MMVRQLFDSINLKGFLSFPPDAPAIGLEPLNVLIGPNGSGKSNIIEAFQLLAATPTDLAQAVRDGGGPSQWIWKGQGPAKRAEVDAVVLSATTNRPMRHKIAFTEVNARIELVDEALEEVRPISPSKPDVFFYYRYLNGRPAINARISRNRRTERRIERDSLAPDQSVLSQRKDPDIYPELSWLADTYALISSMREWTFGRYTDIRKPQPASLPNNRLLPDNVNLVNVLSKVIHEKEREFNEYMKKYMPRFSRVSTLVEGGTMQFFLHEKDLTRPIAAERISDGTLRFIAIIASLLVDQPPRLLCIEEPELGQHPFAVALLGDLLKEASQRMQIVVTTHSDALVSALGDEPQALLVCENNGFGTEIQRLDPEKMRAWLDDYTLGELWRTGQLGGNP